MILYPFPPDSASECGIAGFDEEKKAPAAELYLLAPGAAPPAEFGGGFLFCETPGCRDALGRSRRGQADGFSGSSSER